MSHVIVGDSWSLEPFAAADGERALTLAHARDQGA